MKILFATDGSEPAENAARFLQQLRPQEPLELIVVSVIPMPQIYTAEALSEWQKISDDQDQQRAMSACARVADLLRGVSARIETVTLKGQIGATIIDLAKSREADLIVLGAIGHSTLERLVLGSVSDYVTLHAPCSVLLVRPRPSGGVETEAVRICLAWDGEEPFHYSIEQLKRFRWEPNSQIDVINVINRPFVDPSIPGEPDVATLTSELSKTLELICAPLAGVAPNINKYVVEAEHIGNELVDFCKSKQSDMIVLEERDRDAFERFLLGSVSRYVVRHANCSVWIARKANRVVSEQTPEQAATIQSESPR